MAQTTKAKSRAGSRGRAAGANRRNRTQTKRATRDTRSRSEAADQRRAKKKPNLMARHPSKRGAAKAAKGAPKNKRQRATNLAAERDGR